MLVFQVTMELTTLAKTKSKLTFEIKGEDHTFCNLLRNELWNEKMLSHLGILSSIHLLEFRNLLQKPVLVM
jgi:hypothetical protein